MYCQWRSEDDERKYALGAKEQHFKIQILLNNMSKKLMTSLDLVHRNVQQGGALAPQLLPLPVVPGRDYI